MKVVIKKGFAKGCVVAPPSKSVAHRLLICSALSEGESIIHGVSDCKDVQATFNCLKALGIKAKLNGDSAVVQGKSLSDLSVSDMLYCNESGSTLRFLIPLALGLGKTVMFRGSKSLMQRPLDVYKKICDERKMVFICDEETITVKGPLKAGEFSVVGNISSQFVSGLLFVLPLLQGDSVIKIIPPVESRSYIEMTRLAQKEFGVISVWEDEHTLKIFGNQKYIPQELTVEGDYSGAAFLDALNVFGSDVRVLGLKNDTIQGDALYKKYFQMFEHGVPSIHLGDCPDLGPVLFAVAAAKNGGVFSGTKRLKIKESDRANAMAEELKKFGVSVTVYEDKVVVYPAEFHVPDEILKSHNDHRIAMSLSVLATLTGGEIEGAECVTKSYPAFFEDLSSLGIEVKKYED